MGIFYPPKATTAERTGLTLNDGELVYDETLTTLYIGNGATAGGVSLQGPQGPSVSDGDKGDITVSASGATWTIDAGTVTLAKMADLAQDQVIIRTTASTGVPETATITAAARTVLDDTTVGAMVDTLGGASASGTGGLVRTTNASLVTPALGTPQSGTLTNCDGTAASLTAGQATAGLGLKSATTTVSVSSAAAPSSGQVLTATSSTAATWQTPSGGTAIVFNNYQHFGAL